MGHGEGKGRAGGTSLRPATAKFPLKSMLIFNFLFKFGMVKLYQIGTRNREQGHRGYTGGPGGCRRGIEEAQRIHRGHTGGDMRGSMGYIGDKCLDIVRTWDLLCPLLYLRQRSIMFCVTQRAITIENEKLMPKLKRMPNV